MMRKLLLAFSALFLVPTVACANPTPDIPVDTVARAKFPHVDPKLIDELAAINKFVNGSIKYTSDQSHYGLGDYWVMDPADGKGDCEDYALTKFSLIEQLGNIGDPVKKIDPVMDTKFVGVVLHQGVLVGGHEILAVRLPDHSVMYLDLNHDEPMTRQELTNKKKSFYYEFYDWKA